MEDQKLEQMTEELDDIVDELNKENDRGDADLGPEADRLIEDIEEIEEIEDEEEKQIEEAAEESLAEAEAGENEDPEEAETTCFWWQLPSCMIRMRSMRPSTAA